jgi:hypothetical protein
MNLIAGPTPWPRGEAGDPEAGAVGNAAVQRDRNRAHLLGDHAGEALLGLRLDVDLVVLIEALLVDIDLVTGIPSVAAPRHGDERSIGKRVPRVAVEARRS